MHGKHISAHFFTVHMYCSIEVHFKNYIRLANLSYTASFTLCGRHLCARTTNFFFSNYQYTQVSGSVPSQLLLLTNLQTMCVLLCLLISDCSCSLFFFHTRQSPQYSRGISGVTAIYYILFVDCQWSLSEEFPSLFGLADPHDSLSGNSRSVPAPTQTIPLLPFDQSGLLQLTPRFAYAGFLVRERYCG